MARALVGLTAYERENPPKLRETDEPVAPPNLVAGAAVAGILLLFFFITDGDRSQSACQPCACPEQRYRHRHLSWCTIQHLRAWASVGSGSAGRRRRKSRQRAHPRLGSRLDRSLDFGFWRGRDARRLGSGQARPEESTQAPCLGTRRRSARPSRDARYRRRERGYSCSPLWFSVWRCLRTSLRFRCTLSTEASCPVGLRQCGIRRAHFLLASCPTLKRSVQSGRRRLWDLALIRLTPNRNCPSQARH
jgi:hypothetical protein